MTPIPYAVEQRWVEVLRLGCKAGTLEFSWRPYERRPPEHRADYDRLIVSIWHHGIESPLIVWRDIVLIGMRRAEIAQRLRLGQVPVWAIQEDISQWHGPDLERLQALAATCPKRSY